MQEVHLNWVLRVHRSFSCRGKGIPGPGTASYRTIARSYRRGRAECLKGLCALAQKEGKGQPKWVEAMTLWKARLEPGLTFEGL